MEEIKDHSKDQIAIVKKAEQKKETRLIGRIRPHKGHILYEVNLATGVIKEAEFETTLEYKGDVNRSLVRKKVMVNKDCIYISALNIKNVEKKLIKLK